MEIPKYVGALKGKDFLNTQDFSQEEIKRVLDVAEDLKKKFQMLWIGFLVHLRPDHDMRSVGS